MDDDTFIRQSEVSIFTPQATELEIRELFGNDASQSSISSVKSVAQRSLLYFGWSFWSMKLNIVLLIPRSRLDELLPIYVVLSVEQQDNQNNLKTFFDRLSISLEVRASGSAPRSSENQNDSRESSPGRQEDMIWTGRLIVAEEPAIISSNVDGQGANHRQIAVWEIKALLSM